MRAECNFGHSLEKLKFRSELHSMNATSFRTGWLIFLAMLFLREKFERKFELHHRWTDLSLKLRLRFALDYLLSHRVLFHCEVALSKLNLVRGNAVGEFSACISHLVFGFRESTCTCIPRSAHIHEICRRAGFAPPRRCSRVFCRQRAEALFWNSWGRMA